MDDEKEKKKKGKKLLALSLRCAATQQNLGDAGAALRYK